MLEEDKSAGTRDNLSPGRRRPYLRFQDVSRWAVSVRGKCGARAVKFRGCFYSGKMMGGWILGRHDTAEAVDGLENKRQFLII